MIIQLHDITVSAVDIQAAHAWAHESGIQPWSFDAEGVARLRKYNEHQRAANPHEGRFAHGPRGDYIPARIVPLDAAGNLHPADLDRLIHWLADHHHNGVKRVKLHAPRTRHHATVPVSFTLGALSAARAARMRTGAFIALGKQCAIMKPV